MLSNLDCIRGPPPPSGEMPFSQTVYNSAKFGPRFSPVGGQGWSYGAGLDLNVLVLEWTKRYHGQRCERINVTSAAPFLNLFV